MKVMDFRSELSKISPNVTKVTNIYLLGCGSCFEVLRKWYRRYAGINLEDNITAFIDNNKKKQINSKKLKYFL